MNAADLWGFFIEMAPFGCFTSDVDGNSILINSSLRLMLGLSKEETFNILKHTAFSDTGVQDAFALSLELNKPVSRDGIFYTNDTYGEESRVFFRIHFIPGTVDGDNRIFGIMENTTEQKVLEQQLRQSQKMEALGRLAGGIAHDFNNLLSTIIGYSDLILMDDGFPSSLNEDIGEIKKTANRAVALTKQLLTFGRKHTDKPRIIDLQEHLRSVESMLRRLIGEENSLSIRLAPNLGKIRADVGQIEQIVINMVVNARDAMPGGGTIVIEVDNVEVEPGLHYRQSEVEPGRYVRLMIRDSGEGIDEETIAHVFDPFFTTKSEGRGTGLGLAIVYGIVKQCGGYIGVTSEVNEGATFELFLPRVEEVCHTDASGPEEEPERGNERILIIEDDETVRIMTRKILENFGYQICVASNGKEAVELFHTSRLGDVDLVITDVVMPEMNGKEVSLRFLDQFPRVRVLFISGYAPDIVRQYGVPTTEDNFLQKPFPGKVLARRVRHLLDDSTDKD